jgi:pimeloyl-ACP methyl ester carboxylesterase
MLRRVPLDELTIESTALRGNPLGDPHVRPLWVWTPPGYDADGDREYPSIYVLQGYTGELEMWRNRLAFRPTFPELLDREAPECIVVFVDAWTSVGGSQFVDSFGAGRYHTYLCDEVVPFVDERYRTSRARGVSGKSSGGYGAAVCAMLRPDLFAGFASHAGGGLFEVTIRPFFRVAARALRDRYDGSVERFLEELRTGPAPLAHPDDVHILLQWGFSAAYSADEDGTIRLPYDVATAEVVPELWERWLEWDYPTLVPRHAGALRGMRAIYFDCGSRDEWYVDLTMEWMRRRLSELGVPDLHVELFDGTHLAIEYRYPLGIRYLVDRLT